MVVAAAESLEDIQSDWETIQVEFKEKKGQEQQVEPQQQDLQPQPEQESQQNRTPEKVSSEEPLFRSPEDLLRFFTHLAEEYASPHPFVSILTFFLLLLSQR